MTDQKKINLPSASTLDSGGVHETSGYTCSLYLVPADETGGLPRVAVFDRWGAGSPEPAWHGRWLSLCTYGPQVVGESVRAALESRVDQLVELAATYQGTEWDGNNHRGSWEIHDEDSGTYWLGLEIDEDLKRYWHAGDYYGDAGCDWTDLAKDAGVDPERALSDDWARAVAEVAAHMESTCEDEVSGTEEWLTERVEMHRADT